jgi:hypothetical protein
MITEAPYISDREVYHKLPRADRWIMNKLTLAESLGYACGPTGMIVPAGDYCVRPIMNLYGQGAGGYFKETVAPGVPRNFQSLPGYFWCEWFPGDHIWVQYIDDVPVIYSENPVVGGVMRSSVVRNSDGAAVTAPALPASLQGISKYMMLEMLGDKIIEVTPRFMLSNARQWVINAHKVIDPSYNPVPGNDLEMGNSDMARLDVTWDTGEETLTGWRWDSAGQNRRPW